MKKLIAGILISIIFLYLAFKNVHLKEIVDIVSRIKIVYFIFAFFLGIFIIYIRSLRWKVILGEPGKKTRIIVLFESLSIGQMTNNVFPFRLGDITQAYLLGYKGNLSKSTAFSTVIMERLFDLVPPVMMIISGSFFVLMPEEFSLLKILVFFVFVILMITLIVTSKNKIKILIDRILPESNFKRKTLNLLENFYTGFNAIRSIKYILPISLWTIFVWGLYILLLYSCVYSFGIKLSIPATGLVLAIISMSVIVPSSPGYIGTWEFFGQIALSIFGVEKATAVSLAFMYHFISWLPITLLGIFFVIKNGISISQIKNSSNNKNN